LQKQFGYNTDGAIGELTLKALNMPVEERINQIYVNLERLRWKPDSLEPRYVMVNIADFSLRMQEGRDTLISMRVIVGKNYRKTPVFNSTITYLVLSPTWTVPPTILRNDVLPAVRMHSSDHRGRCEPTVHAAVSIAANHVQRTAPGVAKTVSPGHHVQNPSSCRRNWLTIY